MFDINKIYKGEFIMALIDTEGSAINLNSGAGSNGGFGFGNNDAWVLIILFALIFGWNGNNGFGGGNGAMDNYVLASDFATIQRQLSDGFSDLTAQSRYIQNGLCDGFYAMNTGMLNGFAGVQQTLCQGFNGVNTAINNVGYQTQSGLNAISREIADCCCTTQRSIDNVRYENAKNTCDIIRAGQDNTRAILDYLTTEKISSLQTENAGLKAQISNDRQSAYIIDALAPKCPQAAYVVQPPQQVTFPTNCCGNINYANLNNSCCGSVV